MGKYQELSDLQLLKGIKKYDSRSIEELYNRYSNLLFTVIEKITDGKSELSQKILVEVFVIVWRRIEHFPFEIGNPYTWLVTLARNKAVDEVKRANKSDMSEYNEEYELIHILPTLAGDIDYMELKSAGDVKPQITNAFARLTDAQKYVINLAFYQGFSIDEISGKLNIPVETVRNKVMQALSNLRENLIKA